MLAADWLEVGPVKDLPKCANCKALILWDARGNENCVHCHKPINQKKVLAPTDRNPGRSIDRDESSHPQQEE
jgi:hypothetical protein